jgi:hypothetical protein
MKVEVRQAGEWWAVVGAEGPIRTPMGTPVVSRHRALLDEVAEDLARWGADPTAKTTSFSLQASYLDFGLRVRREVLEENTAAIWARDLFVQRPAEPALARALLGLWGDGATDRAAFREALRDASRRQVIASMTAGHVLHSAVLGHRVVTSDAPLPPLVRGACGRHVAALEAAEGLASSASAARHVPTDMDDSCCAACCAARGGQADASFPARCALHPLFEKLRRWSGFPEETDKR